jgi:uncharacterized oligopeptide transporter (OPT) family protein
MGAGAVAAAGLITLFKTLPTIVGALRSGMKTMRGGAAAQQKPVRTEHDLSMGFAVIGAIVLVFIMFFFLWFKPVPGAQLGPIENLAASLLIVFFGFLFVTVSSRIVGLIGSSANPISGMTIATLMATSAIFLVCGWTAPAFGALAITIGGVVCIASAEAGDTSQDLKTGFLIGATPYKQRIAFFIGIVVSTLAIGGTLNMMNQGMQEFKQQPRAWDLSAYHDGVTLLKDAHGLMEQFPVKAANGTTTTHKKSEYVVLNALGSTELADGKYLYSPATHQIEVQWIPGIGSEQAAAPQARLMATVISGILSRKLPWGLVMLGVFLVIAVELLGIRSLSFAVGAYLSIGTTLAIFTGGVVRWMVEKAGAKEGSSEEGDTSSGSLFASGLIAAGGIVGLLGVINAFVQMKWNLPNYIGLPHGLLYHDYVSVIGFAALAFALFYFARKPVKK